jgi:hypothetical protein
LDVVVVEEEGEGVETLKDLNTEEDVVEAEVDVVEEEVDEVVRMKREPGFQSQNWAVS